MSYLDQVFTIEEKLLNILSPQNTEKQKVLLDNSIVKSIEGFLEKLPEMKNTFMELQSMVDDENCNWEDPKFIQKLANLLLICLDVGYEIVKGNKVVIQKCINIFMNKYAIIMSKSYMVLILLDLVLIGLTIRQIIKESKDLDLIKDSISKLELKIMDYVEELKDENIEDSRRETISKDLRILFLELRIQKIKLQEIVYKKSYRIKFLGAFGIGSFGIGSISICLLPTSFLGIAAVLAILGLLLVGLTVFQSIEINNINQLIDTVDNIIEKYQIK